MRRVPHCRWRLALGTTGTQVANAGIREPPSIIYSPHDEQIFIWAVWLLSVCCCWKAFEDTADLKLIFVREDLPSTGEGCIQSNENLWNNWAIKCSNSKQVSFFFWRLFPSPLPAEIRNRFSTCLVVNKCTFWMCVHTSVHKFQTHLCLVIDISQKLRLVDRVGGCGQVWRAIH